MNAVTLILGEMILLVNQSKPDSGIDLIAKQGPVDYNKKKN